MKNKDDVKSMMKKSETQMSPDHNGTQRKFIKILGVLVTWWLKKGGRI
jgi:hypothetical protein